MERRTNKEFKLENLSDEEYLKVKFPIRGGVMMLIMDEFRRAKRTGTVTDSAWIPFKQSCLKTYELGYKDGEDGKKGIR